MQGWDEPIPEKTPEFLIVSLEFPGEINDASKHYQGSDANIDHLKFMGLNGVFQFLIEFLLELGDFIYSLGIIL